MKSIYFQQKLLMAAVITSLAMFFQTAVGEDIDYPQAMCGVVDSMGSNMKCAVNEAAHAIDVTVEGTEFDGMHLCTAFAGMLEPMTHTLSTQWVMRVFSNQNSDDPAAVCDIG
jgi:hypothetical protein